MFRIFSHTIFIYFQCRGRGVTYRAYFQVKVSWSINGNVQEIVEKTIGEVPIMVKVCYKMDCNQKSIFSYCPIRKAN